jgi:hypothetical protein
MPTYNVLSPRGGILGQALERTTAALASAVCVAAVALAQPYVAPLPAREVREAYYRGVLVPFQAERDTLLQRSFVIGPWRFGHRLREKPRDGRLNFYVVSPGTQFDVDGGAPYSFNCIVNALPKRPGAQVEWDVYWAIVLDPSLTREIRSEQDLLMATQMEFETPEDFKIQDAPGHELLRRYLRIASVGDLDQFRRKSGHLPRMLIVPARVVLRASAGELLQTDRSE